MKVSELRVGNLIQWESTGDIESVIDIKTLRLKNPIINNIHIKDCKPIPLTEEWLLKFGFVSNPYQDRYENEFIHVECNKTRGITELWIERMPHIKYVHQLQNLYFALTGQELELL